MYSTRVLPENHNTVNFVSVKKNIILADIKEKYHKQTNSLFTYIKTTRKTRKFPKLVKCNIMLIISLLTTLVGDVRF